MRQTVHFDSHGVPCEAWLYTPDREERGPAIVMAHGLGGVKAMRLDAYAERFAAAGYACLVFDYRSFGGSGGEPRQVLTVRRQLEDWRAAIAFARALPAVDPGRIVLWGTSFAGGHVLALAAADHRIAAVIAQCPFTDGLASARAARPLAAARLTWRALRDLAWSRRGRPPRYAPVAGPPGSVAMMTSDDALPGIAALVAGLPSYDDRVAARAALEILRYTPGRRTSRITCPVHAAVCEHDSVAPAATAARQIARAPRAEIARHPIGHFDIYIGPDFERAVADALAFLARHVPSECG